MRNPNVPRLHILRGGSSGGSGTYYGYALRRVLTATDDPGRSGTAVATHQPTRAHQRGVSADPATSCSRAFDRTINLVLALWCGIAAYLMIAEALS